MFKAGSGSPFDAARKSRLARFSRVSSLVFELELEDSGVRDEHDAGVDGAAAELRTIAEPWTDIEFKLMHCVRMAMDEEGVARGADLDPSQLAERLRCHGFDVKLCSALGGGSGGECLRNLRHTFLSVCPTPGSTWASGGSIHGRRQRYIVDLHFKEQFEIAQPTERYGRLLAEVPCEFVGTEERITMLVTFMCREMSDAFRRQGHTLPPWRQADSMLSKWRPRRSVERELPPPPTRATASSFPAVPPSFQQPACA